VARLLTLPEALVITLPQPDWPLRFQTMPDGSVQLADVEQSSAQDRMASAAIVTCTPKGHRDDAPNFGVTPLPFQAGLINVERLASEIAQSDPRLEDLSASEITEITDATSRTVKIDVGTGA
jgi:hypothetical protein